MFQMFLLDSKAAVPIRKGKCSVSETHIWWREKNSKIKLKTRTILAFHGGMFNKGLS